MRIFIIHSLIALFLLTVDVYAQFAPIVGQLGTTAMYKDSSAFIDWANAGHLVRGYQDISMPSLGYTDVGDSSCAFGIAGTTGVVSLGDGGYCTLQFNLPIADGIGPDIAVFENGFDDTFLELAFVEVSSDGINFFRFPASSHTDTTTQTWSFGLTDAINIHNLAGKYRGLYGTPFDLADIPNDLLLNKQSITHVKVIDVIGCIQNQYCTRDKDNHKINDPWPTAFGSGGFDLDAVGVIHNQSNVGIKEFIQNEVKLFPNPTKDIVTLTTKFPFFSIYVMSALGEEVYRIKENNNKTLIDFETLVDGIYFIAIEFNNNEKTVLKLVKSSF